jgi:transketolase
MEYDRKKIIKSIIDLSFKKKEGHIPSSLSIIDILFVLYNDIINKENLNEVDRDRFILSKGHASLGLYCVLDFFNLLDENLDSFCDFNSKIGGHPSTGLKYVEASTGSLGHGLPIAVGMSLAYKIKNYKGNVYTIIGDGESNEGTIWESALLASNHKLSNLYCIMDYNHSNDRALDLLDPIKKFESFGWDCISIDGHDLDQIKHALTHKSKKPIFILANTIKGKGVKLMENNHEWHHKSPTEDEYKLLIHDIENK